jgi:hypothetical protein
MKLYDIKLEIETSKAKIIVHGTTRATTKRDAEQTVRTDLRKELTQPDSVKALGIAENPTMLRPNATPSTPVWHDMNGTLKSALNAHFAHAGELGKGTTAHLQRALTKLETQVNHLDRSRQVQNAKAVVTRPIRLARTRA